MVKLSLEKSWKPCKDFQFWEWFEGLTFSFCLRLFTLFQNPRVFCYLLSQLDDETCPQISSEWDDFHCAGHAIECARALGASIFVTPKDLCGTNPKLKMGFTAQIFNAKLGLQNEIEIFAFSMYLNQHLADDETIGHLVPIDSSTNDLFDRLSEGWVVNELLVRLGVPLLSPLPHPCKAGVVLSQEEKIQNLSVLLESGRQANFIDFDPIEVAKGRWLFLSSQSAYLYSLFFRIRPALDHLWTAIRADLLRTIHPRLRPKLKGLRRPTESLHDFNNQPTELLLLRWVNSLLASSGSAPLCDFANIVSQLFLSVPCVLISFCRAQVTFWICWKYCLQTFLQWLLLMEVWMLQWSA